MDGATVFRLMSLIPERAPRSQGGSLFNRDGSPKMDLLCRFLHWLGPLSSLSKEEQQVLGVRASGGRPLAEGEEAAEFSEEPDEPAARPPAAGTQIAA
jgi:hypothetical protein